MKKFLATATMAFVLTGFAAPAFADGGDSFARRMQEISEKRIVEYEKEKAAKGIVKAKTEKKSTASERKTEQNQNPFERFRISESKGGK